MRSRKSGALESRDDNAPDEELEMHGRLGAPVNSFRGDRTIVSRDEMALMLCES